MGVRSQKLMLFGRGGAMAWKTLCRPPLRHRLQRRRCKEAKHSRGRDKGGSNQCGHPEAARWREAARRHFGATQRARTEGRLAEAGRRKKEREGRNEFLPQVGDKSSTAGLISFRWLRFHLAERSANFKGHSAGAG